MTAEICLRPWEFAAAPFRIADGLYYVGNTDVSAHLLDTGDGLLLVDTAFPQTVYLLLESIRRLGFDPGDIRRILHSHGHYDHFGGTRAVAEISGAETYLGAGDVEILDERPELSWAPEYGVEFHETFRVDHPLEDGARIEMGRFSIECVSIPGHTPGATSYFFEATDGGRSHAVGIHGGPGLNTLTDDYLAQYGLAASRRSDYLASVEKMRLRDVDIFLGIHPGQSSTLAKAARLAAGAPNPFVDPAAWGRFLDGLEAGARGAWGG